MGLLFDNRQKIISLLGRNNFSETAAEDVALSVICDLAWHLIVLARWHKRALGAPLLYEQLALQCDCCVLQLAEPLAFQHLPDVLLVHVGALGNQFALIGVQAEVKLVLWQPEDALQRRYLDLWRTGLLLDIGHAVLAVKSSGVAVLNCCHCVVLHRVDRLAAL